MPQQINLYNKTFEARHALLSFRRAVAGWVVIALLLVAVVGYLSASLHALEQEQRALAQKVAAAQSDAQRLASDIASRRHDPRITEQVAHLEEEVKGRQQVMEVLRSGGLGDTRGFSEHLRAFARQSFEGVWLTGLNISTAGRDVSVKGRALQAAYVPGYLKRLNGESAMQGHPFSELIIEAPAPDPATKNSARANYVDFRLATRPDTASVPNPGAR